MASYVVDVELQVKIDKMVAELQKIPGVSTREAKNMAKAWSRDYKQAEKAAERMAREAERQAERVREGWKSAGERTASLMGGVFGDISDSVLDLGDRFGGLADDIGGTTGAFVGLAGITAGVAAAAGFASNAFLEWMDGIKEAREEYERFVGVPPLSPEHEAALDDYVRTSEAADAVSAALALRLKADLAPAASEMQLAFVGLSSAASSFGESGITSYIWSIHEALQMLSLPQVAVNTLWDYFVEVGEEAIEAVEVLTDEQRELNKALEEGSDEIKVTNDELNGYAAALGYVRENVIDLDEEERKRREAARAAAKAAKEAAEAEQKAFDDIVKAASDSLDAMVAYEQKLIQMEEDAEENWDAQIQAIETAAQGYDDLKTAADDYAKAFDEKVKETYLTAMSAMAESTADFIENEIQHHIDALIEEEHQVRRVHQREMKRLEDAKEAVEQQIEAGKISKEEGKAELKRIDEEMRQKRKARREDRKAQKEALLDGFKAQKAAARARAIVDAAANAVALTAAFAYAGPAAPGLALGVAGTQLTIQLAAIRAQKPPKFATGGMVRDRIEGDHAVITASPDEAILTPRGVDSVGGPAGVEALNRGTAYRGGGSTRVYLDGRMLGEVVARVIETDRQVGAALDRRIGAVAGVAR